MVYLDGAVETSQECSVKLCLIFYFFYSLRISYIFGHTHPPHLSLPRSAFHLYESTLIRVTNRLLFLALRMELTEAHLRLPCRG